MQPPPAAPTPTAAVAVQRRERLASIEAEEQEGIELHVPV